MTTKSKDAEKFHKKMKNEYFTMQLQKGERPNNYACGKLTTASITKVWFIFNNVSGLHKIKRGKRLN